jgi:hypothetical protein
MVGPKCGDYWREEDPGDCWREEDPGMDKVTGRGQ